MSTILEARDVRDGRRVAIKVLAEELCKTPELVKRFAREARAASALTSSRAVKIFEVGETSDSVPYMAMELLEGQDLGQLLEHSGPQTAAAAVGWIIDACAAISEAHRLGIIHRDLKPSNLFLCSDSAAVKVLDFGIAKQLASTEGAITLSPVGTPQYMSPEQVRCIQGITQRSDIWSLGVTLYELVCGRPPFVHNIVHACVAAIVLDPVPDPRQFRSDLSESFVAVLMRALAKDPANRFSSIDELVRALRPFIEESVSSQNETLHIRFVGQRADVRKRDSDETTTRLVAT